MKILLFGSNGMLGNYVLQVLQTNYIVICITRDIYDIENDDFIQLETILNKKVCTGDIVINCAGIIPQKYSTNSLKTYIKVNTLFPHKLSEICKQLNLHFIHITTDCVYDGKKGLYSLHDKHNATDIYGISKSLGEPENATIIRTSIIGEELCGKKSLIEWVKSNKNGQIKGYTNHYWNGVTCLELAMYIKYNIDNKIVWKGVKHISSSNIVTKYELCLYINNIYNLNIQIEPYEDVISKNMTLIGDNEYTFKDIYSQIKELHLLTCGHMKQYSI
jgi:dTDP-4-dehydrorhamnose reductase